MPMFRDRYYDIRPKWPAWRWSAYHADLISPMGRGEASSRAAAEAAARACIHDHLNCSQRDRDATP
jgi:hypothetical protein